MFTKICKTKFILFCFLVLICSGVFSQELKELPPNKDKIYLAIIWHQHQPIYFKDPETGMYSKPWVRLHSTKDYYDMVAILKKYPKVKATYNLVPSLLFQLDELNSGVKDIYLFHTEIPANELTDKQKEFILYRFFDANWDMLITPRPGYKNLLDKRGRVASEETIKKAMETFTTQDYLDLQVWFNLAWIDPDFLSEEPLKSLIEKDHNFTEEDKQTVINKHKEIMKMVVPIHKEMQDKGQIEVTTTPFYHPILPLIYDTDLAKIAMPTTDLPKEHFSYPEDAKAHVEMAVEYYKKLFGRPPKGMWPGEGSVAEDIVDIVASGGIKWLGSDEEVLSASLNIPITRTGDDLNNPEFLYKPYKVEKNGKSLAMVFRDHVVSDKIGFRYAQMNGVDAATDIINRVRTAGKNLKGKKGGPFLITYILDGENAWENYPNDGKEFFHSLYSRLNDAKDIVTITPSEFIKKFGVKDEIPTLWAGSWISHDFHIWIGEKEENLAWDYLLNARRIIDEYKSKNGEDDKYKQAMKLMYAAEGSDWFWWYGNDQESGDDVSFDLMYRNTLIEIYKTLGFAVPDYLYVPIISKSAPLPACDVKGKISPKIDGEILNDEWALGGYYDDPEMAGVMHSSDDIINKLYYGYDDKNLYIALEMNKNLETQKGSDLFIAIYFSNPSAGASEKNPLTRYGSEQNPPGYPIGWELSLSFENPDKMILSKAVGGGYWKEVKSFDGFAIKGNSIEFAIPYSDLSAKPYDELKFTVATAIGKKDRDYAPSGPIKMNVPLSEKGNIILSFEDPIDDDYGSGTYTYPTNKIFSNKGSFDIKSFDVVDDGNNFLFSIKLATNIENPWNSPTGLSIQALDIYIDAIANFGSEALLEGRNAMVEKSEAWDYCVRIDGWSSEILTIGEKGLPKRIGEVRTFVYPAEGIITTIVPKVIISGDPIKWGYLVAIMGHDGRGINGIREVDKEISEWHFGGGEVGKNDPNIIDIITPPGKSQSDILGAYKQGKKVVIPMIRK